MHDVTVFQQARGRRSGRPVDIAGHVGYRFLRVRANFEFAMGGMKRFRGWLEQLGKIVRVSAMLARCLEAERSSAQTAQI